MNENGRAMVVAFPMHHGYIHTNVILIAVPCILISVNSVRDLVTNEVTFEQNRLQQTG